MWCTYQEDIADIWGYVTLRRELGTETLRQLTSANVPLTTEAASTGSVGLYESTIKSGFLSTYARHAATTKHSSQVKSLRRLYFFNTPQAIPTHALQKHPTRSTATSITGPSRMARLPWTLFLNTNLLGSVTPADRTWMPMMIRVNWLDISEDNDRGHSWIDP